MSCLSGTVAGPCGPEDIGDLRSRHQGATSLFSWRHQLTHPPAKRVCSSARIGIRLRTVRAHTGRPQVSLGCSEAGVRLAWDKSARVGSEKPPMNAGLSWGTLGPESLGGQRRVRTLGLGAAVRACNEAAVPGIGGLWYAKQLLFSALGVRLAAERRASNIRMANSIEALACLLGFSQPNAQDARLRGRRKLAGVSPDAPFKKVSKPSFYVTQPMRMGMAAPLISLGFALGEGRSRRFNALQLADIGHDFVNEALADFRPYNRTVADHLLKWIDGETDNNNTDALRSALSPLSPMPKRAARYSWNS
jgi:hypothetical protein